MISYKWFSNAQHAVKENKQLGEREIRSEHGGGIELDEHVYGLHLVNLYMRVLHCPIASNLTFVTVSAIRTVNVRPLLSSRYFPNAARSARLSLSSVGLMPAIFQGKAP